MPDITPKPIFDTLYETISLYEEYQKTLSDKVPQEWLKTCLGNYYSSENESWILKDFIYSLRFLYNYRGSEDTFNSYRREIDRLLIWSWFVKKSSILELKRLDIESFIEFSKTPPTNWIGTKTTARFTLTSRQKRIPNSEWKPFVVKVAKTAFQDGLKANKKSFLLSQNGIKQIFAIVGSFYSSLVDEDRIGKLLCF